jgi:hypothetical protein
MSYSGLSEPDATTTGWHVVRDGNAWCALGPKFEDLVGNLVGWGATPEHAHSALVAQLSEVPVPPLSDFRVWL